MKFIFLFYQDIFQIINEMNDLETKEQLEMILTPKS